MANRGWGWQNPEDSGFSMAETEHHAVSEMTIWMVAPDHLHGSIFPHGVRRASHGILVGCPTMHPSRMGYAPSGEPIAPTFGHASRMRLSFPSSRLLLSFPSSRLLLSAHFCLPEPAGVAHGQKRTPAMDHGVDMDLHAPQPHARPSHQPPSPMLAVPPMLAACCCSTPL